MSSIGPEYKNVTCFYSGKTKDNYERQGSLTLKAVVLKGGQSVFWRYLCSIFKHIGEFFMGKAVPFPCGLSPMDLIATRDETVNKRVIIANKDAPSLAYRGYDDYVFKDKIKDLADYLKNPGEKIFDIPLSTKVHGELHMIHLVIDAGRKTIYFIDPKGYKPSDVSFYEGVNPSEKGYTGKKCIDLIVDLIAYNTELKNYDIEICANFQAVMDCVPASEAVVRRLAEMSPEQRDLAAAVNEVHEHYQERVVDGLRIIS